MSDKVAKMPDTKKPALEVEDVTVDMIAQNESALNERLAQLIANDPTASRIQGRLEILRGIREIIEA